MRISDWSSDVCSSDLFPSHDSPGGKGKKKPESMKEKLRSRKGENHHLSEGVWVDDVYYGSKRQAEIALGWGKGTLNYRLKNNPTKWNIKIPDKN